MSIANTQDEVQGIDDRRKYVKKVEWNQQEHYAFLSHMCSAIRDGHKKHNQLDKKGWEKVATLLREENNIHVDVGALKNHYEKGRLLWAGWTELKGYTGLGWNHNTNTYIANSQVWQSFHKSRKGCKRLEKWGYTEQADADLNFIYANNHASGRFRDAGGNSKVPTDDEVEDASQVETTQVDENWTDAAWSSDPYHPDYANAIPYENLTEEAQRQRDLQQQNFPASSSRPHSQPTPCPVATPQPEVPRSTSQPQTRGNPRPSTTRGVPTASTPAAQRNSKRKASDVQANSAMQQLSEAMMDRNDMVRGARDAEIQEFNRCIDLLKSLPGYDEEDPMYYASNTFFLDKATRMLWLAMEKCPPSYAEKWLRSYWSEKHGL